MGLNRQRGTAALIPQAFTRAVLRGITALSLLLFAFGPRAEAGTPYDGIGDNVLAAYSVESWDAVWDLIRAPELGDRLLKTAREDLIPAILDENEVSDTTGDLVERWEKALDGIDWKGLRQSELTMVVWIAEGTLYQTLKISPPPNLVEETGQSIEELLALPATFYPDLLEFRKEDNRSGLHFVVEETTAEETSPFETPTFVLSEYSDGAYWLTAGHEAGKALAGSGLGSSEGFQAIWKQLPESPTSSFVVNFEAIAAALEEFSEILLPDPTAEVQSSFIIDETMEAIFAADPETLEKMKAVQEDFETLAPAPAEDWDGFVELLLEVVGDFGVLAMVSDSAEEGITQTTAWRPEPGGRWAEMGLMGEFSNEFLTLLDPESLSSSAGGLAGIDQVYDLVLEILRAAPDGESLVATWDGLQQGFGLNLKEDLLPALGNTVGLTTLQKQTGGFQGFQPMTSETYVFVELGDTEKAAKVVGVVDNLLASSFQMPVSATRVLDATYSVLNTGIAGVFSWGIHQDPPLLVFSQGGSFEAIGQSLEGLKGESANPLEKHPRWGDLNGVWVDHPQAFGYSNLKIVWGQLITQLQSAQMMFAMMGAGSPVVLTLTGMGLDFIGGIPSLDCSLKVTSEKEGVYVTEALTLFEKREE